MLRAREAGKSLSIGSVAKHFQEGTISALRSKNIPKEGPLDRRSLHCAALRSR
jgi:hypothetical protein